MQLVADTSSARVRIILYSVGTLLHICEVWPLHCLLCDWNVYAIAFLELGHYNEYWGK